MKMQTIILSLSAFQFLNSQKAHFGLLKAVDTASCTEISAKATGVFKIVKIVIRVNRD